MGNGAIGQFLEDFLFPGTPPSPEAKSRIEYFLSLTESKAIGEDALYQGVLDALIEDQSVQGLRLHKGFPLYWIAKLAGDSSKEKALDSMLQAFVEDILTQGHKALIWFAATSLKQDFGISTETLVALKEHVMEKARITFHPSILVKDFLSTYRGEIRTKDAFAGVTEESKLNSFVAQIKEKVSSDLRPSIKAVPINELEVQNVLFALLRQIDRSTERERVSSRVAGTEFKIDFSLKIINIGIEVKLIKEKDHYGRVVNEINADLPSYTQSFERVIFVVYDACGAIDDVNRFSAELRGNRSEVEVLVVKH